MERKILRLPAVMEATGLSRSSIYLAIQKDVFPKSIRLGERAVGWLSHDIDQWITERMEAATA